MASAKKIPEVEWLRVESTIRRLYVDENMTLDALREYLSTNHGFFATKSQCTTKFKAWKLKKNADSIYWSGIRGSLKRKGLAVEDVNVTANGVVIPCKKLKKELQRYAEHEPQGESECRLPATPAGVEIESVRLRHHPALFAPATKCLATPLPWHAFVDAWELVPSSPVLEGREVSPPHLPSHQPTTWNSSASYTRYNGLFFATSFLSSWKPEIIWLPFDLPRTHGYGDSLPDTSSNDLRHKERHNLQRDVNKYFGIHREQNSLVQPLRPYVIERQPEETRNAVRALMDPSSRDTMQILTSYLALLLSNDLLPDSAIDEFVSQANEMQRLGSLNSLFSHTTPSARAVANRVLHAAVKANAIRFLGKAIKSGADIESASTGSSSITLLQRALMFDRPSAATMLIDLGADVNAGRIDPYVQDACLGSAFHLAGITCPCQYTGLSSPLSLATNWSSCIEIIPDLLKNGAILPECPILAAAIKNGANETVVCTLISAGASVNDLDLDELVNNDSAFSPLEGAISCSNPKIVELLLDLGADPNYLALAELSVLPQSLPLGWGIELPLTLASKFSGDEGESLQIVRMLLQRGADPNGTPVDTSLIERSPLIMDDIDSIYDIDLIYDFDEALKDGEGQCSPLQHAARRGDNAMIEVLLAAGATTNPTFGVPPLTTAIWCSHFESAKLLLSRGARPNEVSIEPYCPSSLEAAITQRNLEMIDLLLSYGGDINKRSSNHGGRTPLQRAAEEGNQEIINHLISKGASMLSEPASIKGISVLQGFVENGLVEHVAKAISAGASTDHKSDNGRSPLTAAVALRSKFLVSMLLNAGADVHAYARVSFDLVDNSDIEDASMSPIQWAAAMDYVDVAEILCAVGADIDQSPEGPNGMTAVNVAIQLGNIAMVKFLISRDVDLGADSGSSSAISVAISHGNSTILRLLLEHGADPNEVIYFARGKEDGTVLAKACIKGDLEMVQCLLNAGADVDKGLALSRFIRWNWIQTRRLEIVEVLLSYGVDVNKRDNDSHTPLQEAILEQQFVGAYKLIRLGANINDSPSEGKMGRTALQAAVDVGDVDMVEFLLSKGANVNAPAAFWYGVTALQAAAIKGYLRIAQILLEHGAHIDASAGWENGRSAVDGAAEFGRIDMVELLLDNYDGPVSEANMMKSAYRAAKRGKQWFVMELLQNRWESLGGAPESLGPNT